MTEGEKIKKKKEKERKKCFLRGPKPEDQNRSETFGTRSRDRTFFVSEDAEEGADDRFFIQSGVTNPDEWQKLRNSFFFFVLSLFPSLLLQWNLLF